MSRKDKATLAERLARAAKASLAAQGYASAIDVFLGIGWLNPTTFKDWQQVQRDLETNPPSRAPGTTPPGRRPSR